MERWDFSYYSEKLKNEKSTNNVKNDNNSMNIVLY